eukprot:scaffold443_cov125-Cylindrotheca_fusiformis.AAC.5
MSHALRTCPSFMNTTYPTDLAVHVQTSGRADGQQADRMTLPHHQSHCTLCIAKSSGEDPMQRRILAAVSLDMN